MEKKERKNSPKVTRNMLRSLGRGPVYAMQAKVNMQGITNLRPDVEVGWSDSSLDFKIKVLILYFYEYSNLESWFDLIWFIRISFTFQMLRYLYFFVHWFTCIKLLCENCGENSCFVTICFDDIVKYGKKQYCQFYKVRIAFSFQFYVILLFTYYA